MTRYALPVPSEKQTQHAVDITRQILRDAGVEFPLPENIGNARLHWRAKNRLRVQYFEMCDLLVMAKKIPRPPEKPLGKARALVSLRTSRLMDQDNRHARLKWMWDWLQSRGYLADDKYLDYELTTNVVPRKHTGVHLTIWEVGA